MAVLQEEKMHEKYNIFTKVDDDESSEEGDVEDDDDGSEQEYASFACTSCDDGHDFKECLALTTEVKREHPGRWTNSIIILNCNMKKKKKSIMVLLK